MAKEDTGDILIKPGTTADTGIRITPTAGELPPPLAEEAAAALPAEEIAARKVVGKMPISPAIIKPPLRFEGMVLAQLTGYPGWMYTEEDLEDIAQLILACGWELRPELQIVLALVGLHGAKFAGYMTWKKTGRKGDLRKAEKETGEKPVTQVPGEEVRG